MQLNYFIYEVHVRVTFTEEEIEKIKDAAHLHYDNSVKILCFRPREYFNSKLTMDELQKIDKALENRAGVEDLHATIHALVVKLGKEMDYISSDFIVNRRWNRGGQ